MQERLPAGAAVPGMQPEVALRTLPRDTAAFTGRTRELDQLVAAVSETAAVGGVIGIHAVDGMAGIGKTAFAVHAAHQLAARFPDGQIFLRLHAHTASQSTGASEPPTLSTSRRPSSTSDDHRGRHAHSGRTIRPENRCGQGGPGKHNQQGGRTYLRA